MKIFKIFHQIYVVNFLICPSYKIFKYISSIVILCIHGMKGGILGELVAQVSIPVWLRKKMETLNLDMEP